MRKVNAWLDRYNSSVKFVLWLSVIVWIICNPLTKELWNFMNREPPPLTEAEHQRVLSLWAEIKQEADRLGVRYGFVTYRKHLERIVALEKKMDKDCFPYLYFPLNQLSAQLWNNYHKGTLKGEEAIFPERGALPGYIQHKMELTGESELKIDWSQIGREIIYVYLKIMIFATIIYYVRFQGEQDREKSLKNELILGRKRLLLAILCWWWRGALWTYPREFDAAVMLRYSRLCLEYQRRLPFGRALSTQEKKLLMQEAHAPIENFGATISRTFGHTEQVARKSLIVALVSCLFGMMTVVAWGAPNLTKSSGVQLGSLYSLDQQHLARMEIANDSPCVLPRPLIWPLLDATFLTIQRVRFVFKLWARAIEHVPKNLLAFS